ncbi:MAG: hypothetical protein ACTINM_00065 [Acetobacter cibinongensis]
MSTPLQWRLALVMGAVYSPGAGRRNPFRGPQTEYNGQYNEDMGDNFCSGRAQLI